MHRAGAQRRLIIYRGFEQHGGLSRNTGESPSHLLRVQVALQLQFIGHSAARTPLFAAQALSKQLPAARPRRAQLPSALLGTVGSPGFCILFFRFVL